MTEDQQGENIYITEVEQYEGLHCDESLTSTSTDEDLLSFQVTSAIRFQNHDSKYVSKLQKLCPELENDVMCKMWSQWKGTASEEQAVTKCQDEKV